MSLENKSTPALQTNQQPQDTSPEMAYDPSQLNFDALHVSDPPRRGSSSATASSGAPVAADWVNLNTQDPIHRTGTAMSYHSYGHAGDPRYGHTLPATGWQPSTANSAYPSGSGARGYDAQSMRSFDTANQQSVSGGSYYDEPGTYSYDSNAAQQQYYGQQYSGYDQYGQYNQAGYDQQYAGYYGYGSQYQQYSGDYANGGYGYDTQSIGHESTRPPMEQRQGTLSDMSGLRTQKFKAVDVSQPPYTREYVEQYRARIKGDPDPEAHFAYAKYLVDAAKKIGAKAADQRAVRKYRETLLAEALKTIRRLATQGDAYAEAQFYLANCCGSGLLGLQVDHERAYHLYLQAAKQNHPAASYRVAVCNELGVGTRKDPSRAFAFYRKAASLGDTAAMYKLGMILLSGSLGQPKNTREAIGWLKRAAEQADEDNPHALHELGLLHENPNSGVVIHDETYAKDLFTKAAQLGFVASQYKLGFAYEYGLLGCPIDPKRSIAWYTKAAEKGDAEAELALSGWYLTGSEGVLPQSDAEAYLWARRAANKGLSKAEFAVGYYAEQGIGVKQDIEFAKRWYMRAAAQGNKRAMARLTELKRQGNRARAGAAARPTRQEAKDEGCIIC
ncbi:HCP-like protein [Serendipita vermifera]|nr:HCP-like protein [Serendipita vermifera]